jgi:hypothetical protein
MRARSRAGWLEALLMLASCGCSRPDRAAPQPLLAPRRASAFVCEGKSCRQEHPRLPDTGEWRCAERGGVVWCAGGEPAAGVVQGAADPTFRCGKRWLESAGERVCIARQPDYPEPTTDAIRCWYAQERGVARVCDLAKSEPKSPLLGVALPACWLDRDCSSQKCDRGACRCENDSECVEGRCRQGLCSGAGP